MKAILVNADLPEDANSAGICSCEAFNRLLAGYKTMESEVVYFSAGEGRIKEILIKRDPLYSA